MALFTVNTHHAYLNSDIIIRCEGFVSIEDIDAGEKYDVRDELRIRLTAGRHILKTDDYEEEIIIEDAIKLGGSKIKNAFVFDNNPWIFVTTKDRLYITNRDTGDEKIEHIITPDSIEQLTPYYFGKPCEYFLFQTKQDYAIYNVMKGKIVYRFTNHIYSNGHLVIYKSEDKVIVYDYLKDKIIANFDGKFSFGRKFYFIKDNRLYGLNLGTSYINSIDYVGELREDVILIGNTLLKIQSDCFDKKKYLYFSLGNGENGMSKTEIILPYYIENWEGQNTLFYQKLRTIYSQFKEENRNVLYKYPDITSLYFSIRINHISYKLESGKRSIELIGEIISNPAMRHVVPFIIRGKEGETLSFDDASIASAPSRNNSEEKENLTNNDYDLNKEERMLAKSTSGNYLITSEGDNLYIINNETHTRNKILKACFDTSSYINAYFTGDGKNVILQINKTEGQLIGIEDYQSTHFEVDGFTVSKNEGFNGYKPMISLVDGRIPIWRDPVTLRRVKETEMSKYIFSSPDGKYYAENQKKTIYFNRLTKKEISEKEYLELRKMYDWATFSSNDEKKKKSIMRKQLYEQHGAESLFGHIYDYYNKLFRGEKENEELSEYQKMQIEKYCKDAIHNYLSIKEIFTVLFVDVLDYIYYGKFDNNREQNRIFIGRHVWYLNYVSFSYDSRYLAFGAKMAQDTWRDSEEGVFVLYDIQRKKVVVRKDGINLQAVWMTMFNKKGDVAFYDSHADAYVAHIDDNYKNEKIAKGKSLLCFSPSGRYIALSDQNYIDFTHHPNSDWGHQPSGNVFIYETDNLDMCIEQFNDLGDGIDGTTRTTRRAKNVASAAFSSDEKRMLVVGEDGVVVIRNLHLNFCPERT